MGMFSDLFGIGKGGGGEERQNAIIELQKVGVPSPEEMYVQIQNLIQQGVITPEELDTYLLGPTGFEEISVDPQFLSAQIDSLNQLREISASGGLDAIDKAKIREIQDSLRATSRGNIDALGQQARERGVGGSDFELVSKQMAAQNAANQASREGTDVAAQAQQRKMDAIKSQAALGGQLQSQQYGEAANKAQAQDTIQAFNTANRQNVAATNVGARNLAQEKNVAATQRISDVNTASDNAEKLRRAGLVQQDYQNRLNKAMAVSGQYSASASGADDLSKQKAAAEMGGWNALIGAGATMVASDENLKKDIKPADKSLDEFMAEINPSKFRYKQPEKHGEGERFGTMAQAIEPTEVGKTMVRNTPDGKMLDNEATISALLAAVGRLAQRLDNGGK